MKTEIEHLKSRLEKVEQKLTKYRGCSPLREGWQTQKLAHAEINWDYYAQQKMQLRSRIEELESEENEPHEASLVECDICKHRWTAVRPEGLEMLECPKCKELRYFNNIKTE